MKVTRTLIADGPPELTPICQAMGFLRADIWRRYGALGNLGKSALDIRKDIVARNLYGSLPVDGTIRNETTKDVVNDLLTYKAAAKLKVRQAIAKRTNDPTERKRLYTLLKNDRWLDDPFLHRQMRKHFRHGVSHTANQFIVRSDKHSSSIVDGRLVSVIRIAKPYGQDLRLVTSTNGKHVDLTGCNLRVCVKDGFAEIHYATEKGAGRPHGEQALGIDKGYTEAFTDSDGDAHGATFGAILTAYSDAAAKTGKARNRLHALEKKHRAKGNIAKADRIRRCNLGRKKIDARRSRAQKRLRTAAYQSAHSIVDKAALVVSEDLTSPIASKVQWKRYNRRMSGWAKGTLAEALDSVCEQRGAEHVSVNAAYTSQMDSVTGLLEGRRVGDKFYRVTGDVLQADRNAALNVLARLADPEITRFMPYRDVKRVLLARSPAPLSVKRLELGDPSRQPSADKSIEQVCSR
ncbi:transposase [uncultured Thiocystis sp.]|jgi:IS605 OrfB family transposase|uniref:transposase n=1 Tax=uncultured Thiocystis sp. TaxID=1202134 RepID=UPI0025FABA24|nr:transposase [uncultured Thiocystis sp.]